VPFVPFGIRSRLRGGGAARKAIAEADLVILGGGGLFTDAENWKAPFLWATQAKACRKLKKKYIELNAYKKFSFSFILLGISFLILSMAAYSYKETQSMISSLWLVLSAIFMATGEVFLMPVLLALVTKNAPEKLKNSLVGFLYLCIAFSSHCKANENSRYIDHYGILSNLFSYIFLYAWNKPFNFFI
jgi:dipeptide/tripeptide permease